MWSQLVGHVFGTGQMPAGCPLLETGENPFPDPGSRFKVRTVLFSPTLLRLPLLLRLWVYRVHNTRLSGLLVVQAGLEGGGHLDRRHAILLSAEPAPPLRVGGVGTLHGSGGV